MKILSGYLSPTSGTALIDNRDICTELEEVKKFVGYLPETVPLYKDMTVREFLKFIAGIRQLTNAKSRINEILKITFLEDVAEQIIGTLSKGYRQRVGFAQAIIHDPPVLILDEPTETRSQSKTRSPSYYSRFKQKQSNYFIYTYFGRNGSSLQPCNYYQ